MEKELKEYLWDGETVRWSGHAEPFPLLEKRVKGRILLRWVVAVVCACAALGVYGARNGPISGKAIAIVTLVAALIIVMPWLERRSIMAQTYFVTNWRAILLTRDKTMYYLELEKLDDVKRESGHMGTDTLVLGSAIFEDIHRQLRWRACHPKTDLQSQAGQDQAQGLVFYGIRDADKVEALLQGQSSEETA